MERFQKIFDYLLRVEGGYSDDKYDSGGKTKYGIIEKEARAYGFKGDMRDLDIPFARSIYDRKYYHGNRLNEVNDDRVALSICDWIVNSGNWGAKKAQYALNSLGFNLTVDGKIGNKTIEALNKVNPDEFLKIYHELQRDFYHSVVAARPTQRAFLKGWLNRVDRKEKFIKENF